MACLGRVWYSVRTICCVGSKMEVVGKRVKEKEEKEKMELRGIEPRTSPMLREYYTTKPQPHLM